MNAQPGRTRTPSGFHDEAYKRPRGHDAMQMEFLAFLRARPFGAAIPAGAMVHRDVEGERPFIRNGQVIAFADAFEMLTINLYQVASAFEIKPRIETVFGVVRQAKALLQVMRQTLRADQHWVHVVVPHDDPMLDELRKEWPHVWAWGLQS